MKDRDPNFEKGIGYCTVRCELRKKDNKRYLCEERGDVGVKPICPEWVGALVSANESYQKMSNSLSEKLDKKTSEFDRMLLENKRLKKERKGMIEESEKLALFL